MTMELAIVMAVGVAGACFILWSVLQHVREGRQYRLALRSMSIEEQRFALQKAVRKRFSMKETERTGGKVLPFQRGDQGPPPEVIADLADALSVAKDLPADEAAEYLKNRGYPMVQDDAPPEDLSS